MKLLYKMLSISILLSGTCSCRSQENVLIDPALIAEKIDVLPAFDEIMYNWSRTFAEIMHLTNQKHYRADNTEKAMAHAMNTFLSFLDPHSSFLDQKTYKAILESTSGEFFGIGIILDATRQQKDKFLLIVDTISQGPADTAGLKQLDKIIEVDGKPIEGFSTEEIMAKLRGERNTKVQVKVLREGQPDLLSFEITRDAIKEQSSACFYLPQQNIFYLSLMSFSENSIKQITGLLEKSKKKKAKALILDLRNNSGGLLHSAIDIAGLFLKKGSTIVTTKNKDQKITETYKTANNPIADVSLPIFILINSYTASSAEILAGSLKEHSQAAGKNVGSKSSSTPLVFIVGTTSFGKGSVQEVIPMANNCAVKITTSLYYLLNDVSIQGVGIIPDFIVEKEFPATEQITWFNKNYGKESALNHSIKPWSKNENDKDKEKEAKELESRKKDKEKNWTERARDALKTDNQFLAAVTLSLIFHEMHTVNPSLVNERKKAVDYLSTIYTTSKDLTMLEITI